MCSDREGTGQFKATSPDLTLNGGLYREKYQNSLKLGIEIILNYPEGIKSPRWLNTSIVGRE